MQRLIVGLGNPGEKYQNNRHNVGYLVIDSLLKKSLPEDFIVKKSQVFMNDSGDFVKKLVEQYHMNLSDLWIIHDDLDIPLGSYKIQKGRGPKLHKGINSIEQVLGADEFWRVRVGVENRKKMENGEWKMENFTKGEEYVLQDFTDEEKKVLDRVISQICKKLATS